MIGFSKKIKENEIIFVTPPSGSEGWILEAIAREIANYLPKNVNFSICKFKKSYPNQNLIFLLTTCITSIIKKENCLRIIQKIMSGSPILSMKNIR